MFDAGLIAIPRNLISSTLTMVIEPQLQQTFLALINMELEYQGRGRESCSGYPNHASINKGTVLLQGLTSQMHLTPQHVVRTLLWEAFSCFSEEPKIDSI